MQRAAPIPTGRRAPRRRVRGARGAATRLVAVCALLLAAFIVMSVIGEARDPSARAGHSPGRPPPPSVLGPIKEQVPIRPAGRPESFARGSRAAPVGVGAWLSQVCATPKNRSPRSERLRPMSAPGHTALGAWSGGRYMHFGEPLDEDRLRPAAAPGRGHPHRRDRRRLRRGGGRPRRRPRARGPAARVVLAGGRDRPRLLRHAARRRQGVSALHVRRCAARTAYAGYLREAAERSLERCGVGHFDVLLLHNPDRVGYTSPAVWEAMAGLRKAGCATRSASRPGPRTASRSTSSAAWSASAT